MDVLIPLFLRSNLSQKIFYQAQSGLHSFSMEIYWFKTKMKFEISRELEELFTQFFFLSCIIGSRIF